MNMRQTTEQARAKDAWQKVTLDVPREEQTRKEYGSLARSLPAMIQTNGLGQTLAFLRSKYEKDKPNKAHLLLYRHVSTWVCGRMKKSTEKSAPSDLLEWIINQNSNDYRRATAEALAHALWVRRFAEAQGWTEGAESGGK